MGRNGEGESVARTSSSSSAINSHSNTNTNNTILRTRPDPFLIVCRGFSVITALTAILCIAVNVLSAIRSFKDGSDVLSHSFSLSLVYVCVYVRDFYLFIFWICRYSMEYFGVMRFSLLALWFLLRPNGNSLWSSGRSFFLHFCFSIFNFHFISLRMFDRGKEDYIFLFFLFIFSTSSLFERNVKIYSFFERSVMSSMIHDLNKVRDHVGFIHHHQYIFFMVRLSGYLIWDGIVSCLVWCGVVWLLFANVIGIEYLVMEGTIWILM